MYPHPSISPPAAPRGNYVLLSADTLRLLLPQAEVGAAQHLGSRPGSAAEPGLERQAGAGQPLRFAALSGDMTLLPHCPADRFIVTTLGHDDDALGWCWNELKVLIDVEPSFQPLPAVLQTPDTPVQHYAELAGEIVYLCSAQRLRAFALSHLHALASRS